MSRTLEPELRDAYLHLHPLTIRYLQQMISTFLGQPYTGGNPDHQPATLCG